MEHIQEIIDYIGVFKEEVGENEIIFNKIWKSNLLWKEDLETMIENIERLCSSETNSYDWLRFDWLKSIISMKPFEYLESEETRIENKRNVLIDNRQNFREHGGLYPLISQKGKYILGR